jgi:tRNA pseudouridine38-40 synthase
VQREGDYVWVQITANAYLHHMVRNIVGTLIEAQEQAGARERVQAILTGRDRRRAGFTAPAEGLYLWQVHYPAECGIPIPHQRPLLLPS